MHTLCNGTSLQPKFMYVVFKTTVPTSQITHLSSITNKIQLMLYLMVKTIVRLMVVRNKRVARERG